LEPLAQSRSAIPHTSAKARAPLDFGQGASDPDITSVLVMRRDARQVIRRSRLRATWLRRAARRQTIEFPNNQEPDSTDNAPIDSHFWRLFKKQPETDLWQVGDFATRSWQSSMGEELNLPATYIRVFGVEFCDDDLRKIPGVPPSYHQS